MTAMRERALIERLAAGFARSPDQLNGRHESDAELVRLPGSEVILAITTDAIVEEIAAGLYRDPYVAGWMLVVVNASDLAAVGAQPVGMVVSEALPPDLPAAALDALQRGIRDAAARHGLPILGGDTSTAERLALGGTAIGLVSPGAVLTRCGARPGDRLFASGPVGLGTAWAFAVLLGDAGRSDALVRTRPVARLREGAVLGGLASACMDTSDGVVATLDELMRLNGVGIRWERTLADALHPLALATAREAGLPLWSMLAGPHGEFELLFTVPPARCPAVHDLAGRIGWEPLDLGVVTAAPGLLIAAGDRWLAWDAARVRSLFGDVGGDPRRYLRELLGSAAPAPVGA